MSPTATEQIFSAHAGREVRAGDFLIADVDVVMAQDGNAPLAIELLENEFGSADILQPADRVVLVIDHCAPAPNEGAARMQAIMRRFAEKNGVRLFDIGEGISHLVLPENGYARPGGLVVGSDSHTVTYGALNCIGVGLGATDIAIAMRHGRCWFEVPRTLRVDLVGTLPPEASAKDIALTMVKSIGLDGANGACLEIGGPGLSSISMDGRFTLCNMSIEVGATCSLMEIDDVAGRYLEAHGVESVKPVEFPSEERDEDRIQLDLDLVKPLVAMPHDLDGIAEIASVGDVPIHLAFIGTCTNGRLDDLRAAAAVLDGRHVHPGVRLIVTPGSRQVYLDAVRQGIIERLLVAGAVVNPPGCGPCVGTHQGIPSDGETVISTANRNFRGRMGNQRASIVLGSPETVAASAVVGRVTTASDLD
jgi:3-isopropylmalate/(R)-2-methylmalate dehydratase large subunit